MNQLTEALLETLGRRFNQTDFDLADVVPIPMQGDRLVRLRAIEEALMEFESSGAQDSACYLVQFKVLSRIPIQGDQGPVGAESAGPAIPVMPGDESLVAAHSMAEPHTPEGVYLPDGKFNLPYLFRSAELLSSAGDHELARNIYKAVMRSGEKTGPALMGIARSFEIEGKFEDAKKSYEEAIAYEPTFKAYKCLTSILIRQGKDKQAAETLERALMLKEIAGQARFELHKTCGNCWNRAQNATEAMKHYLKALEIEGSSDEVRTNVGALHLLAGKVDEAKRSFQDAIAINARNAKALAGMASCFLSAGEKRMAHEFFAKSLDLELNNPTAIYYLVKLAYELKTYSTAARLLESYVQVAPINANLLYSLAGLQYHLGRIPESRATALKVIELEADHHGAKELLLMMNKFMA